MSLFLSVIPDSDRGSSVVILRNEKTKTLDPRLKMSRMTGEALMRKYSDMYSTFISLRSGGKSAWRTT